MNTGLRLLNLLDRGQSHIYVNTFFILNILAATMEEKI